MGRRNLIKSLRRGTHVTHTSTQKQPPIVTLEARARSGQRRNEGDETEGGRGERPFTELWMDSVKAQQTGGKEPTHCRLIL